MFVVNKNPQFTHAVEVMTPVDGGHETETFKARFRVIDNEDYDLRTVEGTKDFFRACVVEMQDLVGENDKPLPYNDDVRETMLALPHVRNALSVTYFDALAKARAGN